MTDQNPISQQLPPHVPDMLRVATALLGPADAEDAVQEAIMRAWQAWPTLRDVGAVRPWLLRITVNVCQQWRRGPYGRRQRLEGRLPEESDGPMMQALASLVADPGASDHAAALDLRQALNDLAEEHRVVVVLRYYAGLDSKEIGLALDLPAATVRTRLRRALMLLRDALEGRTTHSLAQTKGDPHA